MGGLTLGAIGAAIIAAAVSLIGLIISKEQKTSEFRQAWVDDLRREIAEYLVNFNSISDALQIKYKSYSEKREMLFPLYENLNKSSFMINLRLNYKEELAKNVISSMKNMQNELISELINLERIRFLEANLLQNSQTLLKEEWNRVKRGETNFIIAKFISGLLLAIFLIYIAIILFHETMPKQKSETFNDGGSRVKSQSIFPKSTEKKIVVTPKIDEKETTDK